VFQSAGRSSQVENLITRGATETELYLTFTFSNDFGMVKEGTPEADARIEDVRRNGLKAVHSTIAEVREMVLKGRI
jgi:hypothetical protein